MRKAAVANILIGAALGASSPVHANENEALHNTTKMEVCSETFEGLGAQAISNYVKVLPVGCAQSKDYFPVSPKFQDKMVEKAANRSDDEEKKLTGIIMEPLRENNRTGKCD